MTRADDHAGPGPGRRLRLIAMALVVALGAGVVVERTVHALFTSSPTATVNLTVAVPVVPRPATVNCQTGGTPLISRWAAFTWTPPTGAPQPTQYVIRVLDNGVEREIMRVAGTQSGANVATTTLVGSLAFLLQVLLLGQTRPVTVNAVYAQYESPSAFNHHLRPELGLVSGIGCAAGAGSFALATPGATTSSTSTTPTTSTTTTAVPVTTSAAPTSTTAPPTTTTSTSTSSTTTAATTTTPTPSTTTTSPPTTSAVGAGTTTTT